MNESQDTFAGDSTMSELMRALDWSATPLGPVSAWTAAWRVAVRMALKCRVPVALGLGPDLVFLYNDAYVPIMAERHPAALGQPLRVIAPEVFSSHVLPLIGPFDRGLVSSHRENEYTLLSRSGFPEETYFTYTSFAIPDDADQLTVFASIVIETTDAVLAARRRECVHEIATRAGLAERVREACVHSIDVLESFAIDFPSAQLYTVGDDRRSATLVASSTAEDIARGETVALGGRPSLDPWGVARAYLSRVPELIEVERRAAPVDQGDEEPAPVVLAAPLFDAGGSDVAAVLVLGLNPHRPVEEMRSVALQVAGEVERAIVNARAREFARERTDLLTALDRAKTVFFSDLSHEFRTPLTLLLGPIEDVLTRGTLSSRDRTQLETAARASRRLLRLVNSLLDFSRIEAGRADPSFEPVDLAAFTSDLAAMFRSAFERAGISLIVECDALSAPTYVDRAMWEKIVLNLLSNALKFTFAGQVRVRQVLVGDEVVLTVADTGCGIAPEHLPFIFERFYRAHISAMRTAEGTGIGLSLVDELVRLHGGSISAASEPFAGTTMTVRIPVGYQHLPRARVVHTPRPAAPGPAGMSFVEEALSWMTEDAEPTPISNVPTLDVAQRPFAETVGTAANNEHVRARLLVVDDNGDMREYLRRILSERWTVDVAGDGYTALDRIRERLPDLVVADVMMPGIDGFELLRSIRDDPQIAQTPVMLVSARTGDEAASEALRAGADDYLTKPFSARELVARVDARLSDARRRAAERRAREAAEEASRVKNDVLLMLSHELRTPLTPIIASAQLLERDESLSADQRESASLILNAAQLEAHFIDDLLDLTRGAHGMLSLSSQRVDLHHVVRRVTGLIESELHGRELVLTVDLQAEAAQMVGDPARLQQVVWNLLQNAVQYTAGGWIRVRSSSMPVGDAEPGAHRFRLEVQDSGIGLEREMFEKIFEPFERGTSAIRRRSGGLGLGLAISRRLAELHGGTLTATSEGEGRGATFVLELPASVAPAARAPVTALSTAHGTRISKRVLLVEDDESSARALRRLLKSYDYDVEVASNRAEALEAAAHKQFDILVSDLQLPDGSGLDLVHQVRRFTPVAGVALSGMGSEEDVRRSAAAGYAEHLVKPPEGEHLVAAIERALQSSSGGDAQPSPG